MLILIIYLLMHETVVGPDVNDCWAAEMGWIFCYYKFNGRRLTWTPLLEA